MAKNDEDIKIGVSADVNKEGFEEGEKSLEGVGDAGTEAMKGIAKEAESAEKAVESLTDKTGESAEAVKDFYRKLAEEDAEYHAKMAERLKEEGVYGSSRSRAAAPSQDDGAVIGFGDNGAGARERRIQAEAAAKEEAAQKSAQAKREETEATKELTQAEKELEDATRERIEQGERDVELAREKRDQRDSAAQESASKDDAAKLRGGAYFAAISASIGAADSLMQDFNSRLAETGTNLEELRKSNPAEFMWVDTIHSLANPLDAIKEKILQISGLDGLKKSAEQAAEMAEASKEAAVQMERWAEVDNEIRLAGLYEEKRVLDSITAALERNIRVEESRRRLRDAQAQATDEAAIAGGADPSIVKAQALARKAAGDIDKLNDDLVLAGQRVEVAMLAASQANDNFLKMKEGADSPEVQKAFTAVLKLRESAEEAKKDVAALEEIIATNSETIKTAATAGIESLGRDVQAGVEEAAAQKTSEVLEKIKGAGGELDSFQKSAVSQIEAILEDGRVTAGEQAQLRAEISKVFSVWSGDTKTLLALMNEANAITQNLASGLAAVGKQQEALRNQVNQITGRLR